jgi:O-antigen/teichoic acid export membrane protein
VIASGPYLIRVLYDARYSDAGWILQYLGAAAWFQIIGATNEAAMLAMGRPYWLAAGNFAKAAAMIVLIPLGFHLADFRGALTALVGAEVCRYGISAFAAARRGLGGVGRDLAVSSTIVAIAAAGALAGRLAATGALGDVGGFLLAGTTVVAAWALLVLAGARRAGVREILTLLRR